MEKGFVLVRNNILYWLKDSHTKKTDSVIDSFITGICNTRKYAKEVCAYALTDKATRDSIKKHAKASSFELVTTETGMSYYFFEGTEDLDFKEIVFLKGGDN